MLQSVGSQSQTHLGDWTPAQRVYVPPLLGCPPVSGQLPGDCTPAQHVCVYRPSRGVHPPVDSWVVSMAWVTVRIEVPASL